MTKNYPQMIEAAYAGIKGHLGQKPPKIGIILGSGLSDLAKSFGGKEISYADIPGFPLPTVAGHAGTLYLSADLVIFAGRFHVYEGHGMDVSMLPIGLMHRMGVKKFIVTNAAGSINAGNPPGSIVLLSDHINMMGINPLIGPHLEGFGPRFPDMSEVYSLRLRGIAKDLDPAVREGIYCAVSGPCYETPAEIRAYRTMGADLVGMSTVPEAILARAFGMETLGISLVTNLAAGMGAHLNHQEVMEEGKKAATRLGSLIQGVVTKLIQEA